MELRMISVSLVIDDPGTLVAAMTSLAADPGLCLLTRAGSLEELRRAESVPAHVVVVHAAASGPPGGAETVRLLREEGRLVLPLGDGGPPGGRLAAAIRAMASAGPRLSGQERAVLLGYASGLTLAAAARRAGIRPATAKKYLERIKQKYADCGRNAYTKLDLATRAREDGLIG